MSVLVNVILENVIFINSHLLLSLLNAQQFLLTQYTKKKKNQKNPILLIGVVIGQDISITKNSVLRRTTHFNFLETRFTFLNGLLFDSISVITFTEVV